MILLSLPSVIRYLICGNDLNLASKIESDLRKTVDWGTQLVLFDRSNNNGYIDVKMDGSVLEEKSSFKMLGLTFLLT